MADSGGIEEYSVLKENKKLKHGTYVRYFTPFGGGYAIGESGNYANGQKQGVWQYYYFNGFRKESWNKLKEKGSFVNGKKNGVWSTYYLDTTASSVKYITFGDKRKPDSINVLIGDQPKKLKQAGMYLNDRRVGQWITFDYDGQEIQRYDFKTHTLLLDVSIKDSTNYNLNRKPVFIGGPNLLYDFLVQNFNFQQIIVDADSTFATVEFVVTTSGAIDNVTFVKSSGSKVLEKELSRLVSMTVNNWVSGLENGQPNSQRLAIGFDLIRYKDREQKIKYKSKFKIPY